MNLISLVVPSFNEAKNLKILCNKLLKIIKQNSKVEVILVNNGSTDDTIKVIRNHPIFKNKIFVLKNERMQLKQSIKLPIKANNLAPYLSTRFPKIGENKNIPKVW